MEVEEVVEESIQEVKKKSPYEEKKEKILSKKNIEVEPKQEEIHIQEDGEVDMFQYLEDNKNKVVEKNKFDMNLVVPFGKYKGNFFFISIKL
jgi:hypothetical protein